MRVYISGAITNTTDYPLRFASAEQKLELMGHEVINPVKVCCALPTMSHDEYMVVCIALVQLCDAVYVLPHSENSEGVKTEVRIATINGIPVHYL